MNRLSAETSPYLLQHKDNPVAWMPWSEQAFELALAENKPVLISIGYSSCHWCHVMAHESFEDEETAQLMNKLFVNIKLDREEYPDIDQVYMDAVQAMTGSGGWPLNVFVTPDKKAFYGGTYFPPVRAHGRASWKEVLVNVSQYYSQNRDEVETQAEKLYAHLKALGLQSAASVEQAEEKDKELVLKAVRDKLLSLADKAHGGFGQAPKFPATFNLTYLLGYGSLYHDDDALQHVWLSLHKMAMGGLYDQIGGGFARYSTDAYWIAPHFEKMLYDNALLLELYAKAYAKTAHPFYLAVIRQTVHWLQREMMSEEGGFFTAQDADSEGVEGKFYTWSVDELKQLLREDYTVFATYYQVKESGNWEHTNILFTTTEVQETVSASFKARLGDIHEKLLQVRNQRVKPLTDDKMLLGINALMNKALVSIYLCTGEEQYLSLAERNMQFLLTAFKSDTHLFYHTLRLGGAKIVAYAEDLVYLAKALVDLANASANTVYLHKAKEIVDYLFVHYKRTGEILFDFTHHAYQQMEVYKQDVYDGAQPSINSVMVDVLFDLSHKLGIEEWAKHAQMMLSSQIKAIEKYPSSFGNWAHCLLQQAQVDVEICIVGPEAKKFFQELYTKMKWPYVNIMASEIEDTEIELLKGKYLRGETQIYVCQGHQCWNPIKTTSEAWGLISP